MGISETLYPRLDLLLGKVDECLSVRLMRLTLDFLVDNHHLPGKIHGNFVADLLALVYLVFGLERPYNYQRYLDTRV